MQVLDARTEKNLIGVHKDLVLVARIAYVRIPFIVTQGVRTIAEQRALFASGATKINPDDPRHPIGRHITGHAIDIAALVNGKVRWDWPLYARIANVMKQAAKEKGIPIEWGGDWRTFKDGPHFQLPYNLYPAKR